MIFIDEVPEDLRKAMNRSRASKSEKDHEAFKLLLEEWLTPTPGDRDPMRTMDRKLTVIEALARSPTSTYCAFDGSPGD